MNMSTKRFIDYVRTNRKGELVLPAKVPKQRSNLAEKLQLVIYVIALGCAVYWTKQGETIVNKCLIIGSIASIWTLILIAVECLERTCMLFEEIRNLNARYDKSYLMIINYVYGTKKRVLVIFSICIIYIIVIMQNILDDELVPMVLTVCAVVTSISKHFHLKHSMLYDSMAIDEMRGLDYGTGMAHSFFHGYLKIMLPKLKEKMETYESVNHIEFEFHKLYILVPLSLDCPHSLEIFPSIEKSQTLESIEIDRAGVIDRVYKNAVYKVTYNQTDKPIYVCCEYATPLKTFHETISTRSFCSDNYKDFKSEIIWKFYESTKRLIQEDPSTRGFCELVYYDDYDESSARKDVGKLLFNKILNEHAQLRKKKN